MFVAMLLLPTSTKNHAYAVGYMRRRGRQQNVAPVLVTRMYGNRQSTSRRFLLPAAEQILMRDSRI